MLTGRIDAATAMLPTTPFLAVVTWQRLVMLTGLVAVIAAGARLSDFRTRLDIPIVMLTAAAAPLAEFLPRPGRATVTSTPKQYRQDIGPICDTS